MGYGENFLLTETEVNKIICALNYQLDTDKNANEDYKSKLYDLRVFLERTRNRKFY